MKDSELEKLKASHAQLEERLIRLEQVVFDSKPPASITLHQQILLLDYVGALRPFLNLKISNVKRAELVALLIGRDVSNVKKALEDLVLNEGRAIKTKKNLHFLLTLFNKANLDTYFAGVMSDIMFHLKPQGKELTELEKFFK